MSPPRRPLQGGTPSRAWQLYTGTPLEGTTPLDPLGLSTGATYNPATGLFSWTTTSSAVGVDGYQEAMSRFSFPLTSVYPDYDRDLDLIELRWDFAPAMPESVARWGIAIGLLDTPGSGYAASHGGMTGIHSNNVSGEYLTVTLTHNGATSSDLVPVKPTAFLHRTQLFVGVEGTQAWVPAYKAAGVWCGPRLGSGLSNVPETAASSIIYAHVGLYHAAAVAGAGEIWGGRMYTRRTRLPLEP